MERPTQRGSLRPAEPSDVLQDFVSNRWQSVKRSFLRSNIGSLSDILLQDSMRNPPIRFLFCSPIDPPRLTVDQDNALCNLKPCGICHIPQNVNKIMHPFLVLLDVIFSTRPGGVRRTAGVVSFAGIRRCYPPCPESYSTRTGCPGWRLDGGARCQPDTPLSGATVPTLSVHLPRVLLP